MDVIIPAHNLKILSSSISTLSKIGKILYIEFDPLDGLTIRALNDAKSSFIYFHFEVGFFERCSSSSDLDGLLNDDSGVGSARKRKKKRTRGNGGGAASSGSKYNTPQRLNRRRGRFRRSSTSRKRSRPRSTRRGHSDDENNDNHEDGMNNENDNDRMMEADEKYLCKVPIKTIASILRPRKGVTSLRIRSSSSNARRSNGNRNADGDDYDDEHYDDEEEIGSHMQLSFEYQIQSDGIMRVLHKVGVSNADGIIALAPKNHCSEIVTLPKVLLTMLDQVKSTTEVALTVSDTSKKVVASSFHYGDSVHDGNNIVLNATNAAILKTETSIDCHEFEDFHFIDEGAAQKCIEEEQQNNNNESSSSSFPPPPEGVAEQVTLVFSIKEAKAMLQFCSASQSSYIDDEDARVIVSFYWGGRPIIIETEGESFRGELILATVDHSLLNGMSTRYASTARAP